MNTQGRRAPDADWADRPIPPLERGEYRRVKTLQGAWEWHVTSPNGLSGRLGNHEVTEHDDGTITVSPSILIAWPSRTQPKRYHGFLRHGVWETLSDTDPMPGF